MRGYKEEDYFPESKSRAGHKQVCPVCGEEEITAYERPAFQFWLYHCNNCHVAGNVVSFHAASEGIPYEEAYNQLKSRDRDFLGARRLFSCQGKFRDTLDEARKNAEKRPEKFQRCFNECGIPYETGDLPNLKSKIGLISEEDNGLTGVLSRLSIKEPKLVVPTYIIPEVIGSLCIFSDTNTDWIGPKKNSTDIPLNNTSIPNKFLDFGYAEYPGETESFTFATQNPRIALFLSSVLEFSGRSENILLFSGKNSLMCWKTLEKHDETVYLIVDEEISPSIMSFYHSNLENRFIFSNLGKLKDKFSELTPIKALESLKKSRRAGKNLIRRAALGDVKVTTVFEPSLNDLVDAYDTYSEATRVKIEKEWGLPSEKYVKKLSTPQNKGNKLYFVDKDNGVSRKSYSYPHPNKISNFHIEHQKILSTPLGEWFRTKALSHVKAAPMILPQTLVNPLISHKNTRKLISKINAAGIGPALSATSNRSHIDYIRIILELANKIEVPTAEYAYDQPTLDKYAVYLPYATIKMNGCDFTDIRVIPSLFTDLSRVEEFHSIELPDNPSSSHRENIATLSKFLIDSNPEKTLYTTSNKQLQGILRAFNPNNTPIKGYITTKTTPVDQISNDLGVNIPWKDEHATLAVIDEDNHKHVLKSVDLSIDWYPKAVALTYYRWIKAIKGIYFREVVDKVFN